MGGVGGSSTILFAWLEHRVRKMSQDGGERGTNDFCSGVHCPLEGLAVCCTTVSVPDSDAAGQPLLNGTPVEGGEDGWRRLALFSRRRKCRPLLCLLGDRLGVVVQVRSSVMCTPRNLVLLTLSTVEVSMVSGGWSTEFLLKSITTSFVFSTLRDRLLAPHPFSQLCHFLSVVRFIVVADETYH